MLTTSLAKVFILPILNSCARLMWWYFDEQNSDHKYLIMIWLSMQVFLASCVYFTVTHDLRVSMTKPSSAWPRKLRKKNQKGKFHCCPMHHLSISDIYTVYTCPPKTGFQIRQSYGMLCVTPATDRMVESANQTDAETSFCLKGLQGLWCQQWCDPSQTPFQINECLCAFVKVCGNCGLSEHEGHRGCAGYMLKKTLAHCKSAWRWGSWQPVAGNKENHWVTTLA